MRKRIFGVLCLLVACAIQCWSAEAVYTLTAVQNSSNVTYANTYDVTINGMTWSIPGNQSFDGYWRIGGKSISNVERVMQSKTPMGKAAQSVIILHNGVSDNSVYVNTIRLTVASNADFSKIVDEVTLTPDLLNGNKIKFVPSAGVTAWPAGSYYRLTFVISNSASYNRGLDFVSATWYDSKYQVSDTVEYALPATYGFYDFTGTGKKGAILPQYKKEKTSTSFNMTFCLATTKDYTMEFEPIETITDTHTYLGAYNGHQEHIACIDDLNGDGIMDFGGYASYVGNGTDDVGLVISSSEEGYTRQDAIWMTAYMDLNRDGRMDLLSVDRKVTNIPGIGDRVSYEYYVHYQQPDGSFKKVWMQEMSQDEYQASFNAEEWQQYVAQSSFSSLFPKVNSGNGYTSLIFIGAALARSPQRRMPTANIESAANVSPIPTMAMDMDGDGWPDLLDENNGTIWYQRENGKWVKETGAPPMTIRDLNGDNIPDMVFVNAKQAIYTIVSKPDSSFVSSKLTDLTVDQDVYIYDFNKDGKPDIAATLSSNSHPTGYAFTILFLNNGDGTFTEQEAQSFVANRLLFKACQDIDGDGYYDLLAYELDASNYATGKVFWLQGQSNLSFANPQELYNIGIVENSSNSKVVKDHNLNIADLDGDGKQEIWASRLNDGNYTNNETTIIKSMKSGIANTAPTAPAKPTFSYEAGVLKIEWGNGSDKETSAADLTYALRIGTTSGGNEILNAHALADGTRRNFMAGNMGYTHSYTLDLRSYTPTNLYFAVQAVDAQFAGSAWSEEVVLEHSYISAEISLDKTDMCINETLTVSFTAHTGDYTHEWIVEDGEVKSESSAEVKITFNAAGEKTITHIIKKNGAEVARATATVNVFPNGIGTFIGASSDMQQGIMADYNFDGMYDIVYGGMLKTGNAKTTTGTPTEIDENCITVRLNALSVASWNSVCLYAWTASGSQLLGGWPGTPLTESNGWYIYSFDKSVTSVNIIWNNGGNGAQTVDITNVTASTCYSLNGTSGSSITASVIDCPSSESTDDDNTDDIGGQNYQFTNAVAIWNANIGTNVPTGTWVDHTHNGAIDYLYSYNSSYYALIHNGTNNIRTKQENDYYCYYAGVGYYNNEQITNTKVDITHNGYFDFVNLSKDDGTLRLLTHQADGSYAESKIQSNADDEVTGYALRGLDTYWQQFHLDFDHDGYTDFAYISTNNNVDNLSQNLTILFNRGEGKFEVVEIPFPTTMTYSDYNVFDIKDLNADGYLDVIGVEKNTGAPYILYNNQNTSFAEPLYLPQGNLENFNSTFYRLAVEDLDNDGYLDIVSTQPVPNVLDKYGLYVWYMGAGGVKQQGFLVKGVDDNNYGRNLKGIRQREHIDLYNSTNNRVYQLVGATNNAPAAPTNIRTSQTNLGLLIEWDAATDDHTPAALLRYNLSVKKAGMTGDGAYLISPQNGGNTEAAVLPDYDYISATRFFIPMSALEARDYEISLQTIDLWNAVSAFSTPVTIHVTRSPIEAVQTVCVGTETVVSYVGAETTYTPVWDFDGGTVASGTGFGPYSVRWGSGGEKNIKLTIDGVTYSRTITIDNPYDLNVRIPSMLLMEEAATAYIPEEITHYEWYVRIGDDETRSINSSGINMSVNGRNLRDKRLTVDGLQITAHEVAGKTSLIEEEDVILSLYVVNQNGCDAWFNTYVSFMANTTPPTITLVTVDENAHNVVNFTADVESFPYIVVMKEGNVLNQFEEIAFVDTEQGVYIDTESDATQKSDRYKIIGVLPNGTDAGESAIHKTVHATISRGVQEGTYNLIWNQYEGANVVTYNILRGSSQTALMQIASVAASATSYTDYDPVDAEPYYVVEYVLSSSSAIISHRAPAATKATLTGRSNVVKRDNGQTPPNPQPDAITVRLSAQSASTWDEVYLYAWQGETPVLGAWPGTLVQKDADGWWAYTFPESISEVNIIWNCGAGCSQTVDIVGVTASTCYSLDGTEGKAITVTEVDCNMQSGLDDAWGERLRGSAIRKIFEDGKIYIILPDGHRYDSTGKLVVDN